MGVVKAFGLAERTGKAVDTAIEESKEANIALEKAFSKMTALYQTVFKLARAAILVFAPYLLAGGSITPEKCLLLLVSSFMIYAAWRWRAVCPPLPARWRLPWTGWITSWTFHPWTKTGRILCRKISISK